MHSIGVAFVVGFLALLGSVAASEAKDPRWQADSMLVTQVIAEMKAGGTAALGPRAAAIKTALAGAKVLFPGPTVEGDKRYVLTDGPAETAVVLVKLAGGKTDVVAIDNPYPVAALMLGSYYNEIGKFSDALKTLDAGLALSPLPKDRLGANVPDLLSERGISLIRLNRLKEALASYDAGLAIRDMDNEGRAILFRGRGFVLVEMGRLDEGAAAYKSSLKFEPGNKLALNELAYIANLQAGGNKVSPSMTKPPVDQR